MRKLHKCIAFALFAAVSFACGLLGVRIAEQTSEQLVTFFSITFGFYVTCIAILHGTAYMEKLYREIDPNNQSNRKIHTLRDYFLTSLRTSIITIVSVMLHGLWHSTQHDKSVLIDIILSAYISGIVAVNIFFMWLFVRQLMESMIQEAREKVRKAKGSNQN